MGPKETSWCIFTTVMEAIPSRFPVNDKLRMMHDFDGIFQRQHSNSVAASFVQPDTPLDTIWRCLWPQLKPHLINCQSKRLFIQDVWEWDVPSISLSCHLLSNIARGLQNLKCVAPLTINNYNRERVYYISPFVRSTFDFDQKQSSW